MAKLDAADRKALPKSDFGEPGKRAYPMPDKEHAANAKARAATNASPAERAKIDAKADRILGETKGAKKDPPPMREHAGSVWHGSGGQPDHVLKRGGDV